MIPINGGHFLYSPPHFSLLATTNSSSIPLKNHVVSKNPPVPLRARRYTMTGAQAFLKVDHFFSDSLRHSDPV